MFIETVGFTVACVPCNELEDSNEQETPMPALLEQKPSCLELEGEGGGLDGGGLHSGKASKRLEGQWEGTGGRGFRRAGAPCEEDLWAEEEFGEL